MNKTRRTIWIGIAFLIFAMFAAAAYVKKTNATIVEIQLFQDETTHDPAALQKSKTFKEVKNSRVDAEIKNLKIVIKNKKNEKNLIVSIDDGPAAQASDFDQQILIYTNQSDTLDSLEKGKHVIKVTQVRKKDQRPFPWNIIQEQRKEYIVQ